MLRRLKRPPLPDQIHLPVDGRNIVIRLRQNAQAKRYLLRIPPDQTEPVVTVPKGGSLDVVLKFVERHKDWLQEKLNARPEGTPFVPGSTVPIRGETYLIVMTGKIRGLIEPARGEDGALILKVPGDETHAPRKVEDWLKREARKDLTSAVEHHTATLGVKAAAISIRDTRSRWGSCASNGRLSFSWRLILAPPEILDYVAAHEVAHLREMNHSDRFWTICRQLAPQTQKARAWLKTHGAALHQFG